MLKIYYNNIHSCFLKKKIKLLFLSALSEKFGETENLIFSVGIRFAKGKEIKELNNKFRNIDKETDVLSFPIYDFKNESLPTDEDVMLGDIVICKKVAKLQAKVLGHSYKREVCFLALHGFLHLLGYDHIEKDEEKEMNLTSEKILAKHEVKR